LAASCLAAVADAEQLHKHHHHGHHHGHHHKRGKGRGAHSNNSVAVSANAPATPIVAAQSGRSVAASNASAASDLKILSKMKTLEKQLAVTEATAAAAVAVEVPGATTAQASAASDESEAPVADVAPVALAADPVPAASVAVDLAPPAAAAVTPCPPGAGDMGIDIDTDMPYGELEPFGREDTAQELTESSITESDSMVDQLERAEVAEEKRAVFRALTRLRGAAITSFDGVARSQTGNIDEYNKVHKWRMTHPLRHLADEESDIAKWAFPDNADF